MSNLSDGTKNLIRLYERITQDAEGWAPVSNSNWKLVDMFAAPELFEIDKHESGGRIRLTEKGKIVAEYLT